MVVAELMIVVVVLKVPAIAALVLVTVVVKGTVDFDVHRGAVIDFTGVETAMTMRTTGGKIVVDVVVAIGDLALIVASLVEHLTALDVEDPMVTVKSAQTLSHMAQKTRYPSNIVFVEETLCANG